MSTYTSADNEMFETTNPNEIRFIEDMEHNGIDWITYSGRFMYGRKCPAVFTKEGVDERRIYRATEVELKTDQFGLGKIFYTG